MQNLSATATTRYAFCDHVWAILLVAVIFLGGWAALFVFLSQPQKDVVGMCLIITTDSSTGTIPTELGKMTVLELFFVYSNVLTGTIPTELGQITAMLRLDVSSNALRGTIPSELGLLQHVIVLNVSSNMLTGTVPEELAQMSNFYFDSTNITAGR